MKLLIALASCVLYLATTANSQTPKCIDNIKGCVKVFMDAVQMNRYEINADKICPDLNTFLKCVLNMKCDIPESQKRDYIQLVQDELKKLNVLCDVNYEDGAVTNNKDRADGNNGNTAEEYSSDDQAGNSSATKMRNFFITMLALVFVYFKTVF